MVEARGIAVRRAHTVAYLAQGHLHGDEKAFIRDVGGWLRDGRIKYKEDVVEGLQNAPQAFIGLLEGRNFGKLLVRVNGGLGSA